MRLFHKLLCAIGWHHWIHGVDPGKGYGLLDTRTCWWCDKRQRNVNDPMNTWSDHWIDC